VRTRAQAGFGALIDTGGIACSPCPGIVLRARTGQPDVRPMKGTARRGATPEEDRALAETLRADPKQRAENLMIVDLMRNDLSRIAAPAASRCPSLFTVETYPTVHQMVSTVTADLGTGHDALHRARGLVPVRLDHGAQGSGVQGSPDPCRTRHDSREQADEKLATSAARPGPPVI